MRGRIGRCSGGLAAWTACALLTAGVAAAASEKLDLDATGSAYYYYSLAQHDRFQRNYLDAVNHLKNAVSYDPDSVSLRLELARLYWLLGNRVNGFERNALAQGEEAVRLAPDSLEAHRFLASVHSTLAARGEGNPESLDRAILHHEEALALAVAQGEDGSNERFQLGKLYLQDGRFGNAAAILEEYLEQDPESVEALFWLSRAYVGQGRLGAAVQPLKRAQSLSPKSFNLSEAMLELQQRRGDVDGAIAAAQRLLELAPDSLIGHTRLAQLYMVAGRHQEAADLYARGERLAIREGDARAEAVLPDLRYGRVEALREAGLLDEAMHLVGLSAGEHPDDPRFRIARGELRYLKGDAEGGRQALSQVLDHAGEDAGEIAERVSRVYLRLGARAEREGSFEESEGLLQSAIDTDPENHVALNYLGYLWADRGINLEQSIRYIERALRIGGENAAYLDSLGWAYYRQRRFDLAEEQLVRAAEMDQDPEILEHLGDLYQATGRRELAVQAWSKALAAGPEDAAAIRAKIEAGRGPNPEEPPR